MNGVDFNRYVAGQEFLGLKSPCVAFEPESLENRFSARGILETALAFKLML